MHGSWQEAAAGSTGAEIMIECTTFEEMLDRLLSGELSPKEERLAEEHVALCGRCSELLSIAHGGLNLLDAGGQDDLAARILRQTSGSPCGRAEALLCSWVDGALGDSDEELVRLHLDHCARCADLATELSALRSDLPTMAELEPDLRFVRDVLDATIRRKHVPSVSRSSASWSRRLLGRPRLALELAYSGAMVIFLLWGTPASPLRVPAERALAVVRAGPTAGISGLYESGSYLAGRVSSVTRSAWDHVGPPLGRDLGGMWEGVKRGGAEGRLILATLDRHAAGIWEAFWSGDLVEAGRILGEAQREMRERRSRARVPSGSLERTRRTPGP